MLINDGIYLPCIGNILGISESFRLLFIEGLYHLTSTGTSDW